MKNFLEILKRELKAYFESPVAYVFLVAYLALMSFFAFFVEKYFEQGQADLDRSFFMWHVWLYLILVPAASMRLWAEERQAGTIELLFTMPVSVSQVLLGKFFAAWLFLGIALALTSPIVLTTALLGGNLDGGAVFCGYLGSLLVAGAFLSVGMLASSLTRNQVISFVASVIVCLVMILSGFRPITDMFVRWAPGWLVDGVAAFSVVTYFDSMRSGVITLRDLAYFASVMVLMLTATQVALKGRRTGSGGGVLQGAAGLVVIAGILVGLNVLARNAQILRNIPGAGRVFPADIRLQADLTEDRIHSLSRGSRSLVSKLDRPVTLKFFFSEGDPDLPAALPNFPLLKGYARRVDEMLDGYRMAARGKIRIERHDPRYGSDAEKWARDYGINEVPLENLGPSLYLGLVAESGGSVAVIPLLDPKLEDQLEYDITRMIARVSAARKPVVGVLSSMEVLGRPPLPFPMMGQTQDPVKKWVVFEGLDRDYEFRRVETASQINTNELDALLLVNAKRIAPSELYAIDQFALSGKPLAIFADPLCYTEQILKTAPNQFTMPDEAGSLDSLFKAWGVKFDGSMLVGDAMAAWNDNPAVLGIDGSHMNGADVLMSRLDLLLMPLAGSFSADGTNADVRITPLINSSEQSTLLPTYLAQVGLKAMRDGMDSKDEKSHALAVRLEGRLKTAFPDGAPKAAEGQADVDEAAKALEGGKKDAAGPSAPGLKESAAPCNIILVGDCDMLYDQFCVEPVFFLGRPSGYQMMNHNIIFFINLVDQIARGADLAGIKAKTRNRPFKYVQKLTRQANRELLKKDNELAKKLRETEEKLSALQGQRDPAKRFGLTDEQKAAIAALEQDAAAVRNEQRHVKSEMRRSVVRVGMAVKAANMLLMPVLVAIGGIIFGLRRVSRRRA